MASTRNKNTQGNYKLEKTANINQSLYPLYEESRIVKPTYHPGDGLGPARMGTFELSENWCDIETGLFGIGSNNLENPQPEVVPKLKNIQSLHVIDKLPLFVPRPMNVSTIERPMFLN